MAYNYQSFATLGVNLNRQNYGSLDISQVFTSQADLNYYMSKGALKEGVSKYWLDTVPYPYAGQYVALVDNATRGVTPYILTEKEDGTFEATKLGVPEVDGETIQINSEGKLEAIIPEYADTNTTYKLSVTATEEGEAVQGVKITLTPYDGETAGTPQSFVIADPDLSDYITTSKLNAELAKKANAADVYTKAETETKIGEAVAAADHLKRKIVEAPGEGETIEDVIDKTADDADQYIYMVPTGLQESDNKYREYIVIIDEATGNRYIEQVGNWEVDLSGYLTIASADETYAKKNEVASTYATKSEVATTLEGYVTDQELSTTLNGYATKNEIPTDYVSVSELANYDTAAIADGKYAPKQATAEAIEILQTDVGNLKEVGAEKNIINSVSNSFIVTADRELQLKEVQQNVIAGLEKTVWELSDDGEFIAKTQTSTLAEILTPAYFDETTGKGQSGLMTAEQAQKLSALVIGDGGNIEISGKVNAENVEGLSAWITNNRNNVPGLMPTATQTLITELNNTINDEETGVVVKLAAVEAKAITLENDISKHSTRLEVLEKALQWQQLEEKE